MNFNVVLKGVVFTEVEMEADSAEEAARKAEEWIAGKTGPHEVNDVDFMGDAWTVHEIDEIEEV